MAIQYPGGTLINTTFTGTTKQDIVAALEAQLTLAGWSVVSGAGSTDVLMQSAVTPTAGNFIRARLRSTNLTNCCCVNMQNTAADRVSQNYFLLAGASKTYRIIANKYQFFCTTAGAPPAREFVCMGTLYVPSFLHGVITGELGWCQGNANSDSMTGGGYASFRTILNTCDNTWNTTLYNGNMYNHDGGGGAQNMDQRLIISLSSHTDSTIGYRWHDGSLLISDPLMAFGASAVTDEARIRGQLWGSMVISDVWPADTILSGIDSHDWISITQSNMGNSAQAKGTLFVAVT